MTQPLVSVCIASYNHGRFLPGLFESLIRQTYTNIELVFVNDCSPDDTAKVLEDYRPRLESRFAHLQLINNSTNKGAAWTAEYATSLARGDYISYLESDDFYLPNKIERNVQYLLENPDYDAVHSDFIELDEEGRLVHGFWKTHGRAHMAYPDGITYHIPSGWIREELMGQNFIGTLTIMVKREPFFKTWLFAQCIERDYILGDYAAHMRLSKIGKIGYIDDVLAVYRKLSSSMSNDPAKRQTIHANAEKIKADAAAGLL
jgi:glycosyltransferase involved in cell wall biosynthesis